MEISTRLLIWLILMVGTLTGSYFLNVFIFSLLVNLITITLLLDIAFSLRALAKAKVQTPEVKTT